MSAGSLHLALDQGGSQSRAFVVDDAGEVVAHAEVPVATTHPADDRVEQDGEELAASLRKAIKAATKRLGARVESIVDAGLATQRSSVAAWDRTSWAPLAPVLSWQDRRAAAAIAQLNDHAAEVRARTGLRLSPHYGASKMSWLVSNVPEVRRAMLDGRLALGPLASFLAFRLADERPFVADPANASRTLLFDLATGDWSDALLDLFGVPRAALPKCVPTTADFGTVDVGKRRVPLRIVTGDQSAALFARGEPRADAAYVTFGTGAFVLRVVDGATPDAPNLLRTLVHRDAERALYALEGTINGAGAALVWASRELGLGDALPDLESALVDANDPPLFLNGVGGLAAPYWRADFRSRFLGEGAASAKLAAVLESVVFLVEANLAEMSSVVARPARIVAGGGLARLDGLCQRLADVSGITVERPAETESTALGLAHLLGAGVADDEVDAFEPRPNVALHARYEHWRELVVASP